MLKDRLGRFFCAFDEFLYTPLFPAAVSAFILAAYILRISLIGLAILVLIACFIMVRKDDITPLLPMCFGFVCLFRTFDALKGVAIYLILAPFLIALIYHFVKFPLKKPVLGKLFFPFFLITCALFLSGIFSAYLYLYANGLLYAFTVGPLLWFAYFLFGNYLRPPENFDVKRYLSLSVVCSVLIMCLAFFWACAEQNAGTGNSIINGATVGFANTNNVGAMILLAFPLCLFLFVKEENHWFYLVTALFFIVTILLFRCDGGSGVLLVFSPFMFVLTYLESKKENRGRLIFCLLVFVLVAVALLFIVFLVKGYDFITAELDVRTGESGRSHLYNVAFRLFKENPLFGAGLGYSDTDAIGDYAPHNCALRIFNFHSTLFQVAGCMGIFGLIAYAVYFYKRYEIVTENSSVFNVFMFFAFTMFECYGMIDTCEFNIVPCMLVLTVMLTVTETENRKPPLSFENTINAFVGR